MNNNIFWILETSIKPEQLETVKQLMTDMITATKAEEPGCLNYVWHVNESDSSCRIFERFADSSAAMTHLGNFGEHFAERFLGSMDPTGLQVYGNPSDEVAKALSGFGAVFYAPSAGFAR